MTSRQGGLTREQLEERLAELLAVRYELKQRIRTLHGVDLMALRLHGYACREVTEARRELDKSHG